VNYYHKINEVDRHVLVLLDLLLVDPLTLVDPLSLVDRPTYLGLVDRLTSSVDLPIYLDRHGLDLEDRPIYLDRHGLDLEGQI
jgi:hypothetical protein